MADGGTGHRATHARAGDRRRTSGDGTVPTVPRLLTRATLVSCVTYQTDYHQAADRDRSRLASYLLRSRFGT